MNDNTPETASSPEERVASIVARLITVTLQQCGFRGQANIRYTLDTNLAPGEQIGADVDLDGNVNVAALSTLEKQIITQSN